MKRISKWKVKSRKTSYHRRRRSLLRPERIKNQRSVGASKSEGKNSDPWQRGKSELIKFRESSEGRKRRNRRQPGDFMQLTWKPWIDLTFARCGEREIYTKRSEGFVLLNLGVKHPRDDDLFSGLSITLCPRLSAPLPYVKLITLTAQQQVLSFACQRARVNLERAFG